MEKYDKIGLIGEGSYGLVMKCLHKESGQMVAIKKFLETDDDKVTKRIALREIRMLKQLRHENLVNLIEVFRRKKRLYLVFEYVDHTILDDLEAQPYGLDRALCREYIFQVLRAIQFCHSQNVIHRDVKPENVLVSKLGVVKLCDFGFARMMSSTGQSCTDYVATRWYRAPELLVGDTKYGREVDIWAIGCLFAEMLCGEPLFPGDSDIDQIHLIIKCLGPLINKHEAFMEDNPMFLGLKLTQPSTHSVEKKFPKWSSSQINFCKLCLNLNPLKRPNCDDLLADNYFQHDAFPSHFMPQLQSKIHEEFRQNPLLRKPDDVYHKRSKPNIRQAENCKSAQSNANMNVSGQKYVFRPSPSRKSTSYLFPFSMKSSRHCDSSPKNRIAFADHSTLTRIPTSQDCSAIGNSLKESNSWLHSKDSMPRLRNDQESENYSHKNYSTTFFNIFNPIGDISKKKNANKSSRISVENSQDLVQEGGRFKESQSTQKNDFISVNRPKKKLEDENSVERSFTSANDFYLPNVSNLNVGDKRGRKNHLLHPISTQNLQPNFSSVSKSQMITSPKKSILSPIPPYATNQNSASTNLPDV